MFATTPPILRLLAAIVWYIGVVVLLSKSVSLLLEAERINPEQSWTWLAILGGLTLGVIKAKYLFIRLCIKNLKRIDALEQPKIWHFYRIHFFIFLFLMITLGGFLSRLAHGDYPILITVAMIEISIATALLGSSHIFWKAQQ